MQHHAGVTRQRVLDILREADAPHVKGHALRHFRLVHIHRQFGALLGLYLSLVVDLAALDGNGVGLGLVVGVRGGIRVRRYALVQHDVFVRHGKLDRRCFQPRCACRFTIHIVDGLTCFDRQLRLGKGINIAPAIRTRYTIDRQDLCSLQHDLVSAVDSFQRRSFIENTAAYHIRFAAFYTASENAACDGAII